MTIIREDSIRFLEGVYAPGRRILDRGMVRRFRSAVRSRERVATSAPV